MEKWINRKIFCNIDIFNTTTIVLLWLLDITDRSTLTAVVNSDRVNEFISSYGISRASYYRSIQELEDKGIIANSHGGIISMICCQGIRKSGELPFICKK